VLYAPFPPFFGPSSAFQHHSFAVHGFSPRCQPEGGKNRLFPLFFRFVPQDMTFRCPEFRFMSSDRFLESPYTRLAPPFFFSFLSRVPPRVSPCVDFLIAVPPRSMLRNQFSLPPPGPATPVFPARSRRLRFPCSSSSVFFLPNALCLGPLSTPPR